MSEGKGSKANRQLRELQRLMAWSWDSRVDEHPPSEKAMEDFENVLHFHLDARRRRCTLTPAAGAKGSGAPAADSPAGSGSGAKQLRKGSAERSSSLKRSSPALPGSAEAGKAGRKGGKAARVSASPTGPAAVAAAAPLEQQQQQASPLLAPCVTVSPAPTSAAGGGLATAAAAALPADSPAAGAEPPVEATPAVRLQRQQERAAPSPADLPLACTAEVTPAVRLGGVAHTPSSAASEQLTGPATHRPASTVTAAALADAQFLPTPATLPLHLAASAGRQPSCDASATAADAAPAALPAAVPLFRAPAPRSVMTSLKRKAEAPAEEAVPAEGPAAAEDERRVLAAAAGASADPDSGPAGSGSTADAALALDLLAAGQGDGESQTSRAACSPQAALAMAAGGTNGSAPAPMNVDTPAAAKPASSVVPAAGPDAAAGQATAAMPAVTTPAAESVSAATASLEAGTPAGVPCQVMQAFAAADQMTSFRHPRPSTCPPLFKQPPAGRAPGKSPLGKKGRTPGGSRAGASASKENASLNGSSGGGAAAGFTPRTAEPAAPPQVMLSAWKQQQLAALSAGFHSRQRRLLELLSACNRATAQPLPAAPAAAAAPAASKPPLGPRAAAVAASSCWAAAAAGGSATEGCGNGRVGMGRALGRLKGQQTA